jgi:hypothetical protein
MEMPECVHLAENCIRSLVMCCRKVWCYDLFLFVFVLRATGIVECFEQWW